MPSLSYDARLPLAAFFRELMRDGTPPAKAVEQLIELFYAFHFHIVQRLPDDLHFLLGSDDELVVTLPDGQRLDPEKILIRGPGILDSVPIRLETYRWMCADPRQAERDALTELMLDVPADERVQQVQPQPEAVPTAELSPASVPLSPTLPPSPSPLPEKVAVETEPARQRGGRDPEHLWEDMARQVDELTKDEKLPLHPDGKPNIQRGIDKMAACFKTFEPPPPPTDGSIRRWINAHRERTRGWWLTNN